MRGTIRLLFFVASMVLWGADPAYEHAIAVSSDADRPGLLCKFALVVRDSGDLLRAEQLTNQALDQLKRDGDMETANAAACLTLSGALAMRARPEQAQQDLEKALAIRERLLGPQSLQLADTLNTLGMVHRLQERYVDAERYYRRALAIQRAHPPTPELGITLNNLGQLAAARGRSKEALELFHQAVETWEGLPGPPNPGMATALNQAGVLAYKNKQYAEATALLEKAGSAEALLNLGAAHLKEKRFHESAQAYQRAIELLTKQWGPGDARLATPLDHLAFVLRKDEQYADAAEVELQATRIRVATALR